MGKNLKKAKKAGAAKPAKVKSAPKKSSMTPVAKKAKESAEKQVKPVKKGLKPATSSVKPTKQKKSVAAVSSPVEKKAPRNPLAGNKPAKAVPATEKKAEKVTVIVAKDKAKKATAAPSKKEVAGSAAKKTKKKVDSLDDELLTPVDDEIGSEDLPDLSEFEEESTQEVDEGNLTEEEVVVKKEETPSEEVILTDAEGRRYCKVKDCDQIAVVEGYCRFHYLFLWKKIQVRRKILIDGKLQRYVEELTARYPDKFLEIIRKDLRTEKDFLAAIAELEIDESAMDSDFEDDTQVIDEVRGFGAGEGSMSDDDDF